MKRASIRTFFSVVNYVIRFRFFLGIFNFIYERLSFRWVDFVAHHIVRPAVDYRWTIILPNHRKIITPCNSRNTKTWEFALSYKSNDPALNLLENELDHFYGPEIPWIDVGANLGIRSLTALSSHRPVYFIEPNSELNAINLDRCKLNNFTNYTFLPYGASDQNGELVFYIDTSSYLSSLNAGVLNESQIQKKEVIPVRTLDSLFSEHLSKSSSACIKIDTEGHEANVLAGATTMIGTWSPTMMIEINEKGEHLLSVLEPLRALGYTIYGIRWQSENEFLVTTEPGKHYDETFMVYNFLMVKDAGLKVAMDRFVYRWPA